MVHEQGPARDRAVRATAELLLLDEPAARADLEVRQGEFVGIIGPNGSR
jgi:ABC-type branched-subunit amino acid transport system ATPase component